MRSLVPCYYYPEALLGVILTSDKALNRWHRTAEMATNNITMGWNFGREKRKYSRKNTDGDMALKQRHRTLEMAINGTMLGWKILNSPWIDYGSWAYPSPSTRRHDSWRQEVKTVCALKSCGRYMISVEWSTLHFLGTFFRNRLD